MPSSAGNPAGGFVLQRISGRAKADFFQRCTGTFSADGRSITGRWERSTDGQAWELDFELVYTRVA